ncbi:hypothetical protein HPB49_018042 [Dermacentor silvarum]|uniref:Uncharacterized protein n=1 Tax=Dermacentor silvarum TaxID=543639 RepID=A0ACB8CYI6_DERSI|nr:hypothetical protein HPB49_018042 [Dermacentor silvarum]
MATLEDRILGEKLQYYCSSSSEDEDEPAENDASPSHVPASEKAPPPPPPELKQREGCSSVNTGPKGVLKDWQRYQQLQNERREEQERERLQLIKKLSLTCRSEGMPGCEAMNGCLQCLAEEYPQVKFCTVEASAAGMSRHFERKGVPALLVYKNGALIGNFVRLTDEFGDDFFAVDVESFLVE